jgi:gamma-glutamylcyclotransferase (GGCT)/AIG2-like uncharacterized protein YtfP
MKDEAATIHVRPLQLTLHHRTPLVPRPHAIVEGPPVRSASPPRHLFVYGTLRPGHAPSEIAVEVRRLREVGRATVRGGVYDLGAYPGAVLDESAATAIDGRVLHLTADASVLAALDAYEGFDPADAVHSLFLRTRTVVTLRDGRRLACWIYVWNGDPRTAPARQPSRQSTK